jgi:hypothetical protein
LLDELKIRERVGGVTERNRGVSKPGSGQRIRRSELARPA